MNSDDDDLDLLHYINSNNKSVKVENENQRQPSRKRIKIEHKSDVNNDNMKNKDFSALYNVEQITNQNMSLELTLRDLENDFITTCKLHDSW